MSEIEQLREAIRRIDAQLLELIKRRNEAAQRIGSIKRKEHMPLQNFEVEKSVLDHARSRADALGIHPETADALVRLLIQSALRVQERDPDSRPPRTGRVALVVGGAGHMGEWFCRFLEEQGFEVHVQDPRPHHRPTGDAKAHTYDLVLIASPPSTIPAAIESASQAAGDKTLIVDIGSVKGDAVPVLQRMARAGRRVASLHPMFGPSADILMGKNVLVLDAGRPDAAADAARLFAHTAARTLSLPLEQHDAFMAEVLTLSHAASLAFNRALAKGPFTYAELEPCGSTTFRKQVEVSREVARETPRLYFEIQALNPASGPALERLERGVADLRAIVQARDERRFSDFMAQGLAFYGGST